MIRKYGLWFIKLFPTIIKIMFFNAIYHKNPRKKSRIKKYKRYQRIMHKGNRVFGVDFYIEGKEKIAVSQSYLLTPNHQSMLDAVLFFDIVDDPVSFASKSELRNTFIAGDAVRSVEGVFLERDNLRQEIKMMKIIENSMINDNLKWVIFPEGTRTKNNDLSMNQFKPGAFKPAQKAGVDIIPVALYGSFRVLQKNIHWKRYPVQISFLDPIKKEEYENLSTVEISSLVQQRIQEKLLQLKERDLQLIKPYQK
ncbi:MAG: lysophospholipid acyltransferase family protein [Bacilli bacterium]